MTFDSKLDSEIVDKILSLQKQYNDNFTDLESDLETQKISATFRKISIPVLKRILGLMETLRFVKVKPTDRLGLPFYKLKTELIQHESMSLSNDKRGSNEAVIELMIIMAHSLANEFDQHIISEIRSNVSTTYIFDPAQGTSFVDAFSCFIEAFCNKCTKYPNVIVASVDASEILQESFRFTDSNNTHVFLNLREVGVLNVQVSEDDFIDIILYENPFASKDEIIAIRFDENDIALEFCPRAMLQCITARELTKGDNHLKMQTQFEIQLPEGIQNKFGKFNINLED